MGSKEEFPDLKPSNGKRHDQPEASTSRQEIPKSEKHGQPRASASGKDMDNFNHDQKKENPEVPDQHFKKKTFKHLQDGKILDFQFVSEKRVKCPKCKKEYKNILRHLQKSSCRIADLDDLIEKFKDHKKVHFQQEIKDEQRHWKANSRAKQPKTASSPKELADQNRWKQKSRENQREVNNRKV